jgi:hypothetical protein
MHSTTGLPPVRRRVAAASAGTAPSRRSRTRNNRLASALTLRRSRRIHRRTDTHSSAWFPFLQRNTAGR